MSVTKRSEPVVVLRKSVRQPTARPLSGAGAGPSPCPFRATCKSPLCTGAWSSPDCPGSRKGG